MISKTIKFTDFDGVEKTKTFYFNLTKAELSRMLNEEGWDFKDRIMEIIRTRDIRQLVMILEDLVLRAYGEKTADGYFLKKRPDGTKAADLFVTSPAFSELYFELIQDPEKFAAFINALVPAELTAEVKAMQEAGELPAELEGMM